MIIDGLLKRSSKPMAPDVVSLKYDYKTLSGWLHYQVITNQYPILPHMKIIQKYVLLMQIVMDHGL